MPTSPTECLLSAKQVQAYNEGDNADMPAGLSFLQIFYGKFNPQISKFKVVRLISFALICAIAHQRLIFLKDERL